MEQTVDLWKRSTNSQRYMGVKSVPTTLGLRTTTEDVLLINVITISTFSWKELVQWLIRLFRVILCIILGIRSTQVIHIIMPYMIKTTRMGIWTAIKMISSVVSEL